MPNTMYLSQVALLVSSNPDSASELYWKTVLPNSRMPNAIKSLLISDQTNVLEASSSSSSSSAPSPFKGDFSSYYGNNLEMHLKQPNVFPLPPLPPIPPLDFNYNYAASKLDHEIHCKKLLKKGSQTTIFFLQEDLHLGKKMNLNFPKQTFSSSQFLPRKKSNSIPFSTPKLSEIFTRLSVNPKSREAQLIKYTIKHCEEPGIKGEEKFCAISLEDMIDFSISKLGNMSKKVQAISTETKNATGIQRYEINGVKKMGGASSVVCHKQNYPYAVFYCHKTSATEVYMISLVGDHGGKVEAAAVCHQDTSAWNPRHLAFVLLKVDPGTAPICHLLPEDHVVWIKN